MNTTILKKITLLYVEDDVNIRDIFSKGLQKRVKELYVAQNGEEGYELYKMYHPDIILTDIKMPIMNGIEMIRKIRVADKTTPIHITTAHNESEFFLESIEQRVMGYHLKPINKNRLFEKLNESAKIILFEKERIHNEMLLQKMFNLQKNIIVLTDGMSIKMANLAVSEFFGFSSLENFMKQYKCICNCFIEDENFFNLSKVPLDKNWIETLLTLPKRNRIVSMLDSAAKPHAFTVSINDFDEGHYLITFSDISDTMLKQFQLEKKVSHDRLTGAYSREFFYNEIKGVIQKSVEQKLELGLVMFDIDYFKLVNDTYGHNVGDTVLKILVDLAKESIRSDDLLIRWGGEEFIVLVLIENSDLLYKMTEHIRSTIEEKVFEQVEHITCSFGLTLYHKHEAIHDNIERADKALYKAKEDGRNRTIFIN